MDFENDQEKGSSQIFCVTWVKRNVAKAEPDNIKLTEAEIQNLFSNGDSGNADVDDAEWEDIDDKDEEDLIETETNEDQSKTNVDKLEPEDNFDDLKEYDLDRYDSEDDAVTENLSSLVAFPTNDDDPYITKKNLDEKDSDSECEAEEKEAVKIKPDDNLLVCIRSTKHFSTMEVYVYNHNSKDFYVHHDIPLSRNPLCTEWIGYDPGNEDEKGNLLATGTLESVIEIWDLNIMNSIEPVLVLGSKKLKHKKKRRKLTSGHSDAVLDLAWNENLRNTLASASVDKTVRLWDIEMGANTKTMKHSSKVQTIQWRPKSDCEVLSGGFNAEVLLTDVRNDDELMWQLEGEIERVIWNPNNDNIAMASSDQGLVYSLDVRKPGKVVKKWEAHESAIPGLSILSAEDKTLLVTASSDECVKIWNVTDESSFELLCEKKMNMGMVHCCAGNPDIRSVVAVGGQRDNVKIWNTISNDNVSKYFQTNPSNVTENVLTSETIEENLANDVLKYFGKEDKNVNSKSKKVKTKKKKSKTNLSNNSSGAIHKKFT